MRKVILSFLIPVLMVIGCSIPFLPFNKYKFNESKPGQPFLINPDVHLVMIENFPNLELTDYENNFAVELWIYPISSSENILNPFLSNLNDLNGFSLSTSGGCLFYETGDYSNSYGNGGMGWSGFTLDSWNHVVFNVKSDGGEVYINNILEDSDLYRLGIGLSTNPLLIGASISYADGEVQDNTVAMDFNGYIMETAVFNRVLTPVEISEHYFSGLTGAESGLIGYWKMDEGAGQMVSDSSTMKLDGIMGSSIIADDNDPVWVQVSSCPPLNNTRWVVQF